MIWHIVAVIVLLLAYREFRRYRSRRKKNPEHPIMKGGEPFYYKKGKTGALLIHGFTGSPSDFRELGKYLADKGITVSAPLMPGHATAPEELAQTTDEDWYRHIKKSYAKLRKDADEVFAVGLSFGGNLGIRLAEERKVAGLVLLGAPASLRWHITIWWLNQILSLFKDFWKKNYHTKNPEIHKGRVTYDVIPIACMKYVLRTIKKSRNILHKIKVPLLIMQSRNDMGVNQKSAKRLYRKAASEDKQIKWIENSYHVLLVDKHKKEVIKDIYNFIKSRAKHKFRK